MESLLPDRPNIVLHISTQRSFDYERDLLFVASDLRDKQEQCEKMIIFAQSINTVVEIYEYLLSTLGSNAFIDGIIDPNKRLISMYHGQIGDDLQKHTLSNFVWRNW